MDRRQQKTRKAIFQAVSVLLESRRFEQITVQQIINEANIGRSTFYAHFETKEELLKAMCTDMFQHVCSEHLRSEQTHDFSAEHSLASTATHILYHLRDSRKEICGIFASDSSALFLRWFRAYLGELFAQFHGAYPPGVPEEFVQNHLVSSFLDAVQWWIGRDMRDEPEQIVAYYLAVTGMQV